MRRRSRNMGSPLAKWRADISAACRMYIHLFRYLWGTKGYWRRLGLAPSTKPRRMRLTKSRTTSGKQTALHYAQNNGMTAIAIKAYREGRERVGADVGSARVVETIMADQAVRSRTQLLCTFCKQFHEMTEVMVTQGCAGCMSELTKAAQLYNCWEALKMEGFDCTCTVCIHLPAPEIRPALG
jgi:hypothetical protein